MSSTSFPFLPVLVALPLVGAIATAFIPKTKPQLAKVVALAISVVVLGITVAAVIAFDTNGDRLQLAESYKWIPQWGLRFSFAVDGIALVMVALSALLVPIVILASWKDADDDGSGGRRNVPTFFALMLALEATMIGVFAASDVLLFYIFFEVMLVPMYFLIGSYGGPRRQYAAVKFFLYSLVGGMLMLAAVIGLWVTAKNGLGHATFDWQEIVNLAKNGGIPGDLQKWLFLGFFAAFAIKAPFFPFHTWLPDAGGAAPAGAAALLVGVLDKVGTYGILRYCLPIFPEASKYFATLAIVLSLVGVLYGALLAVGQTDLKRLVAYTSISHFGFIGIGIFAFSSQAVTGSVLYMVNHGLATGLLFIVVGFLVRRRGSQSISDFGGAGKLMPLMAGVFLIAGLASLALPGTSPFVSEFLVLIGTFSVNKTVAILAALGMVLAAAYILWMFQRTMQGTLNPALKDVAPMKKDLSVREKVVVAPLIVLIIALGVYPKPVLDMIEPAVKATIQDVGKSDPVPTAADGAQK
ncbi:NADH-quinone oxidoreductase subunit M [Actinorhabdospora filicis]|uniref:NADH-quinone oxidoreductase subunit M n=1 Tax=Actinorhabdospora filicis TaxID=1785913 RepID=A0A9W6SRF9_9ACTN|nr:NADH-quinone oxidoreductase subunit M [Actinorhabdospora filicis]GLZ80728.1 NADH-quinone oxidoreductase subunit M [Actinorhabdospora filicis]